MGSRHGLKQGPRFGAEKAFEGGGSRPAGEAGCLSGPGAVQRRWRAGPPRALTRRQGSGALQDLCPLATFFTGFSATGAQLVSSQGGISRSSSVLSHHDHPAWLTSPLGTWKLRPDRQRDQKLRGVAETNSVHPPYSQGLSRGTQKQVSQSPDLFHPGAQFIYEDLHIPFFFFQIN